VRALVNWFGVVIWCGELVKWFGVRAPCRVFIQKGWLLMLEFIGGIVVIGFLIFYIILPLITVSVLFIIKILLFVHSL
jgi:hypothetical protein